MSRTSPAVVVWRVHPGGFLIRVGELLADAALPSLRAAIIGTFPRALPEPGRSALYKIHGLDADGRVVTGDSVAIDGDDPEVRAARAAASPLAPEIVAALREIVREEIRLAFQRALT